jgi:hypothetical protein
VVNSDSGRKNKAGIAPGALEHTNSRDELSIEICESPAPMLNRGLPDKARGEKCFIEWSISITRANFTCCLLLLEVTGPHAERRGGLWT